MRARAGNDRVRIDDANGAFTDTIPTVISGGSGNDRLAGDDGDDGLHGDSLGEVDGVESGDGRDKCDGGAGLDTAARCEKETGVP